ncbi:dihydrofolate reductase family protein [Dyella sp. C9]|uniref:dihydrofolate reductase family protein n=1 Tax=Dyella sp. C9 TaxID=2202154 RepID=UPI000DEF581F|nr:dihydrofolate reductase family protein [Dyella sp. C9]
MRKLILLMSISLDGFVSGPEGDVNWIFSGDREAIAWKVDQLRNAGLLVMGSRSFQAMAPFWPTATTAFAPPMNQVPKAVFSKQGKAILEPATKVLSEAQAGQLQPGAESWAQAQVASGDLAPEMARLKAVDGKPIIALGGASFARSLVALNLVDEYVLMVHPIALGTGEPIFSDLPGPRPLTLVDSRPFPLGALAQIYRPT